MRVRHLNMAIASKGGAQTSKHAWRLCRQPARMHPACCRAAPAQRGSQYWPAPQHVLPQTGPAQHMPLWQFCVARVGGRALGVSACCGNKRRRRFVTVIRKASMQGQSAHHHTATAARAPCQARSRHRRSKCWTPGTACRRRTCACQAARTGRAGTCCPLGSTWGEWRGEQAASVGANAVPMHFRPATGLAPTGCLPACWRAH